MASLGTGLGALMTEFQKMRQDMSKVADELQAIRKENRELKGLVANVCSNQKTLQTKIEKEMGAVREALTLDPAALNDATKMNFHEETAQEPTSSNQRDITEFLNLNGLRNDDKKSEIVQVSCTPSVAASSFYDTVDANGINFPSPTPSEQADPMCRVLNVMRNKENFTRKMLATQFTGGLFLTVVPHRIETLVHRRGFTVARIDEPSLDANLVEITLVESRKLALRRPQVFFRKLIRAVVYQLCGRREDVFRLLVLEGSKRMKEGDKDLILVPPHIVERIVELCVCMTENGADHLEDPKQFNRRVTEAHIQMKRLLKSMIKDVRRGRFIPLIRNAGKYMEDEDGYMDMEGHVDEEEDDVIVD